MNINLYYQDRNSDKVYNACITPVAEGYYVDFSYGRRGSSLTTGRKNQIPTTYDQALTIFDKLVKEKTAKGYKESGITSTISAVVDSRDTGVKPQLLNECSEQNVEKYLTDSNWCAQEKFDGENRLLFSGKPSYAANRKGLTVTVSDKIQTELDKITSGAIIAGEDLGDKIVIFDQIDDFVKNLPYIERLNSMIDILENPYEMVDFDVIIPIRIAWTTDEKRALYAELKARDAEGIVFKNIHAVHEPGRPSSGGNQLKFKFYETASCIVSGINTDKRSIQLSLYDAGKLHNVGNATVYPNQDIPELNSIVEIKYLYAYPGGSLYQPIFLKPRHDVDASECLCSKLKYKPS